MRNFVNTLPKKPLLLLVATIYVSLSAYTYGFYAQNLLGGQSFRANNQPVKQQQLGRQTSITVVPTQQPTETPTPTPTQEIIEEVKAAEDIASIVTSEPPTPTTIPTPTPLPSKVAVGTYKQFEVKRPKGFNVYESIDDQVNAIENYLEAENVDFYFNYPLSNNNTIILSRPNNLIIITQMKRYYTYQSFKDNFLQTTHCQDLNSYFYKHYLGPLTKVEQEIKNTFAQVGICTATHKRNTIGLPATLVIPAGTLSYYYVYYPQHKTGFIVLNEFRGSNNTYKESKQIVLDLLKSLQPKGNIQ